MFRSILILLIISPLLCFSQENISFSDATYFETMRTKLNLKIGLDNDIETFEFDDDDSKYSVRPNTDLRMTIGINHKFLNLKFGFSPKFLASDESSKKGSTKVFKLAFTIFIKNWIQGFDYSNIGGYYIEDISDINLSLSERPDYIILPDMRTIKIRGSTSYKFNDKFSLRSILNQSEIQRKSAGSFIPSFVYEYFKISGKSSILKIESVNLILAASYFYTFVIKKNWYFNLSAGPGIGLAFNKLLNEDVDRKTTDWSNAVIFNLGSHLGFGYNSESFFGGISYRINAATQDKNSVVKFDSVQGIFNVFFGYRFGSPKFVDKSFDWIEGKIPVK